MKQTDNQRDTNQIVENILSEVSSNHSETPLSKGGFKSSHQQIIFDSEIVPPHYATLAAEGKEYFKAVQGSMPGFETRFLHIVGANETVKSLPYFETVFDLSTMVPQAWLKFILRPFRFKVNIVGHPVASRPHIDQQMSEEEFSNAIEYLQTKTKLLAIKGDTRQLPLNHFVKTETLPIAVLKMKPNMLQSLKKSRTLARKMKDGQSLKFAVKESLSDEEIQRIYNLYVQTYERASIQFGKLDISFFKKMNGKCTYVISTYQDKIVGFAQLLQKNGHMVAGIGGVDATVGREHGVYFAIYFQIIQLAEVRNIATIEFGETCYEFKKRIGCELQENHIYFLHRSPVVSWILKKIKFLIEPSESDLK